MCEFFNREVPEWYRVTLLRCSLQENCSLSSNLNLSAMEGIRPDEDTVLKTAGCKSFESSSLSPSAFGFNNAKCSLMVKVSDFQSENAVRVRHFALYGRFMYFLTLYLYNKQQSYGKKTKEVSFYL